MSTKSLWGDLSDLEIVRTPKEILMEQAQLLTEATDGVLVGNVESQSGSTTRLFIHDFDVTVPTLNNYSYTLLRIRHGVAMYPVRVEASDPSTSKDCPNEEEFISTVGSILSSSAVRFILSRLRSQAG
jgi:hypothetical protein